MAEDPNMGKFSELMQQAQEHAARLQSEIEKTQEQLGNTQTTGKAPMIEVTMNGRYYVTKVQIEPRLLEETPEMVNQVIASAVNKAVENVQKISQRMVSSLAGNLQVPDNLQDLLKNDGEDK